MDDGIFNQTTSRITSINRDPGIGYALDRDPDPTKCIQSVQEI